MADVLNGLGADFILAKVYFLDILVDSLQKFESALFIESIISQIDLFNAMRNFETLGKSHYIVVAHSIVFKVDLIFVTFELYKPIWYWNQIFLAALF